MCTSYQANAGTYMRVLIEQAHLNMLRREGEARQFEVCEAP